MNINNVAVNNNHHQTIANSNLVNTIEDQLIKMNYPHIGNASDNTHEVIRKHLTGERASTYLETLPVVAEAITEEDLTYLKERYELIHGLNSEGQHDSWLVNKKTGKRNKVDAQGYRNVKLKGKKVREHRLIMAMFHDCPIPGWVVVNHDKCCTIWSEGKSNDILNLRFTSRKGNQVDKKVREGAPNIFTGYRCLGDKWKVQPQLLDGSRPYIMTTASETTAYIMRCLVLLHEFGEFWWSIKGEAKLAPQANPSDPHKLIMSGDFGYNYRNDWALHNLIGHPDSDDCVSDVFWHEMVVKPISGSDSLYLQENAKALLSLRETLSDTFFMATDGIAHQEAFIAPHVRSLRLCTNGKQLAQMVVTLERLYKLEGAYKTPIDKDY